MTHRQFEKWMGELLKPCPFCGRKPYLVQWRDTLKPNATWIQCKCGVMTDSHYNEGMFKAAHAAMLVWNRRKK